MNQNQIDALIEVRNRITDVCSDFASNTAAIDAVLAEIPAGVDNRVDLLLGRPEAQLPPRPDYGLQPIVIDSICFSEEHQYLHCSCGYDATGLIDGIKHQSECTAPRHGYIINPVVTLEQPETIALIEMTRIIFEQAAPIEY